ncbi:MAG: histidine kinase [Proteobacteria bacterium]|nr:histidine kinase [Pseudomonadota bacterium]
MDASSFSASLRRFADASVRAFHCYGNWLVGISWKRFFLLSLLLFLAVVVVHDVPPLSWRVGGEVRTVRAPEMPDPPKPPEATASRAAPSRMEVRPDQVQISVGPQGVWIRAGEPASAASAPEAVASGASAGVVVQASEGGVNVHVGVPPGADAEQVREAVQDARTAVVDALEAVRDAQNAAHDAQEAAHDAVSTVVVDGTSLGQYLIQLAMLWIVGSMILKITYKGQLKAQVQAAQATETAEAEALRRQVVEARMAAMQAQVEPHFLFNTLASIEHLIETDPPRASQMQRHLIALLRASMPSMREAPDAPRPLASEMALVRPYVEILKMRMDERLDAHIDVPEGLLSAEFPTLMLQTLVENAIRHGLEPKSEGGQLRVAAQIVHGKLEVVVADTGVGFGAAATSGSGVGLANIRERLQLRYGNEAALAITANTPSGTVVRLTLPYRSLGNG